MSRKTYYTLSITWGGPMNLKHTMKHTNEEVNGTA